MNQKINAGKLRVGNIIVMDNKLYQIRKRDHVKPGKGGAFVQVELQGVDFDQKRNERLRPEDTIEKAILEEQKATFLYEEKEGKDILCMFMFENGDQIALNKADFYPLSKFLTDGIEVKIEMHGEQVVGFDFLTDKIAVKIETADPALKGQTASSSFKNAILENGEKVMVPVYVESGDEILINPSTLEYAGRA